MNAADPPQSTHVVRRIILSFTLTIGLIAVIALISYGWTQLLFAAERERVELVVAGTRQHALSQRIALSAERLMDTSDPEDAARARAALSEAIDEMTQQHQNLIRAVASLPSDDPHAQAIRRLYSIRRRRSTRACRSIWSMRSACTTIRTRNAPICWRSGRQR